MSKHLLIDASHPEETRVAVLNKGRLEEYDIESHNRRQLKGNLYLAKIIRIEPALQAAFVDYGESRHGFLPLSEIHPDYFQIPVADKEKLLALRNEERAWQEAQEAALETGEDEGGDSAPHGASPVEHAGGDEPGASPSAKIAKFLRSYRIQEVLKRRQVLLVQVVKEERGNKGAALTTFLSLPGRYCVLMPNALQNGGISRKVHSAAERKRLRSLIEGLDLPPSMAMIVRTAGNGQPNGEILRDCGYLLDLWETIRDRALTSTAPALIHEEASLVKRALRDLFNHDTDTVLIDGQEGYEGAREYAARALPQAGSQLKLWKNQGQTLFSYYNVDDHLDVILSPIVQLESGGYIVINQTEALVAIDVNSGKSTAQRNVEETAFQTNLEAAEEIARQLRLRDLAGLVVIDFIDMDKNHHNQQVEKTFRDALRNDRARIQMGSISSFGLLEMSRQRLRPSVTETLSTPCEHCKGTGITRSIENMALRALRLLERECPRHPERTLQLDIPSHIALYLLNNKREALIRLEKTYNCLIRFGDGGNETAESVKILPLEEKPLPVFPPTRKVASLARIQETDEKREASGRAPMAEPAQTGEETVAGALAPGKKRTRISRRKNVSSEARAASEEVKASVETIPVSETENSSPVAAETEEKKPGRRKRTSSRRSPRKEQEPLEGLSVRELPDAGGKIMDEAIGGEETADSLSVPPETAEKPKKSPARRRRTSPGKAPPAATGDTPPPSGTDGGEKTAPAEAAVSHAENQNAPKPVDIDSVKDKAPRKGWWNA